MYRDPLALTIEACRAAITDAGLKPEDIDGLSTYPGMLDGGPGFNGANATEVQDAMRLELDWFDSGVETSGQLGSVIKACMAVGAGLANHVLCFRSVWEGSAQKGGGRPPIGGGGAGFRASGSLQWTLPFAAPSAAIWVAMFAARPVSYTHLTLPTICSV